MQHATSNTEEKVGSAPGFKGLRAWQAADRLASAVYQATKTIPRDERWLALQMVRAAVSVPANIAEGHGRGSYGDYLRFLDIARGSLSELEYYLHFIETENLLPLAEIQRIEQLRIATGNLLHGLWRSMKAKSSNEWDHTGAIHEDGQAYLVEDDGDV